MKKIQGLHGWIDSLPATLRETVRGRMKPRRYEDGQAIYLMGDEGHELFQIVNGKVRAGTYTLEGREVQMAELRKGDCFGELSLISNLGRVNYAFSVGKTELLVLQRNDFEQLYSEYPEIPRELNRLLARRLYVTYTRFADASLLALRHRLTRMLSRLAYSTGELDEGGKTLVEGVTHEQLAAMLGVTRQAISREMRLLEKTGLVHASYGKVCIPDIAALVASCDMFVGDQHLVPDYSD
jgi:CRP/FNR family cyclic AMP-dependent transcriptional regulator